MINIVAPNNNQVKYYLNKWDNLEKYVEQEKALNLLFLKIYPQNRNLTDILIKSSTLNNFYSTNIFSIYEMAKHIYNLKIDDRLANGDLTLVKDIATLKIKDKEIYFYSFATKYCSHHNPLMFPIYDSYVEEVLIHFKKKDRFYKFKKEDLKDYEKFINVLLEFRKFYKLEKYNLKELDKYLWQLGKIYFLKPYNKSDTKKDSIFIL